MNDTHHPDRPDHDVIALLDRAGLAPTDSFRSSLDGELRAIAAGDNVATLQSARQRRQRRNLVPLLAGAAAAVALVVAIAVVSNRSSSDLVPADTTTPESTDEALSPLPEPAGDALEGDALLAEIENRRWLAVERFDVAAPVSLTSRLVVSGSPDNVLLTGHDGCDRYEGRVTFDGTAISAAATDLPSAGIRDAVIDCGVDDTLQLDIGQRVEIAPGANEFLLRDEDGRPVARFVDDQSLPAASRDDVVGPWLLDGADLVEFRADGSGGGACLPLTWTNDDGRIRLDIGDEGNIACGAEFGIEPTASTAVLERLLATGPDVLVSPDGLIVTDATSAVQLYRPLDVEVDANGVTLAAGAIFGIEPGLGVTPDEVIAAVEPRLGEPDLDTGWLENLNDGQMFSCDLADHRMISWGDLDFLFWGTGGRTMLLAWYVGDRGIVMNRTPAVDSTDRSPSGLLTDLGVGVGDLASTIPAGFTSRVASGEFDTSFQSDDVVRIGVSSLNPDADGGREPALRGGSFVAVDGVVVAYGAETFTC